jgi:hypothetical protein
MDDVDNGMGLDWNKDVLHGAVHDNLHIVRHDINNDGFVCSEQIENQNEYLACNQFGQLGLCCGKVSC